MSKASCLKTSQMMPMVDTGMAAPCFAWDGMQMPKSSCKKR